MQDFGEDMVDLDIEVSNAVVFASSGETPVEHGSSRRRILMLGDERAKQRKGKICEPVQSSGRIGSSVM